MAGKKKKKIKEIKVKKFKPTPAASAAAPAAAQAAASAAPAPTTTLAARRAAKRATRRAAGQAAGRAPALAAKQDLSKIESTAEVVVSDKLINQIIGQEKAVDIIKKAASQKRNVLLVGYPGTGKSLIAQAMSELMPVEELQDVLVYPNPVEENNPKIEVLKAGEGRKRVEQERARKQLGASNISLVYVFFIFIAAFFLLSFGRSQLGDVITAAMLIGLFVVGGVVLLGAQLMRGRFMQEADGVRLLIDNSDKKTAPFVEATGARAGALLGDCRHDPFQSFKDAGALFFQNKHSKGSKKKNKSKYSFLKLDSVWRKYAKKYPELIERNSDGYQAIVLPKSEELFVLGLKNGQAVASRVLVINRRPYDGEIVEVRAGARKLETTPEHAFIIKNRDKPARNVKKGDVLSILRKTGFSAA